MKFNRIDDHTINCLITQDDLIQNGIDLDDLLKRTPKAMDYLRRVLLEAAQAENFTITGEFTSMQVRILKDQSISLTLSQGKGTRTADAAAGNTAKNGTGSSLSGANGGTHGNGSGQNGRSDVSKRMIYAFTFDTMADAIACCRNVPGAAGLPSSLWFDDVEGVYYLFFASAGKDDVQFEKAILAMNEFGTFAEVTPEEVAYIMEHRKCILKENAAAQLVKL